MGSLQGQISIIMHYHDYMYYHPLVVERLIPSIQTQGQNKPFVLRHRTMPHRLKSSSLMQIHWPPCNKVVYWPPLNVVMHACRVIPTSLSLCDPHALPHCLQGGCVQCFLRVLCFSVCGGRVGVVPFHYGRALQRLFILSIISSRVIGLHRAPSICLQP